MREHTNHAGIRPALAAVLIAGAVLVAGSFTSLAADRVVLGEHFATYG